MLFKICPPQRQPHWRSGDDETIAETRAKATKYIRAANKALAQPQRCTCGQCGWCVHNDGLPPVHLRHRAGNEILYRSGTILSVR